MQCWSFFPPLLAVLLTIALFPAAILASLRGPLEIRTFEIKTIIYRWKTLSGVVEMHQDHLHISMQASGDKDAKEIARSFSLLHARVERAYYSGDLAVKFVDNESREVIWFIVPNSWTCDEFVEGVQTRIRELKRPDASSSSANDKVEQERASAYEPPPFFPPVSASESGRFSSFMNYASGCLDGLSRCKRMTSHSSTPTLNVVAGTGRALESEANQVVLSGSIPVQSRRDAILDAATSQNPDPFAFDEDQVHYEEEDIEQDEQEDEAGGQQEDARDYEQSNDEEHGQDGDYQQKDDGDHGQDGDDEQSNDEEHGQDGDSEQSNDHDEQEEMNHVQDHEEELNIDQDYENSKNYDQASSHDLNHSQDQGPNHEQDHHQIPLYSQDPLYNQGSFINVSDLQIPRSIQLEEYQRRKAEASIKRDLLMSVNPNSPMSLLAGIRKLQSLAHSMPQLEPWATSMIFRYRKALQTLSQSHHWPKRPFGNIVSQNRQHMWQHSRRWGPIMFLPAGKIWGLLNVNIQQAIETQKIDQMISSEPFRTDSGNTFVRNRVDFIKEARDMKPLRRTPLDLEIWTASSGHASQEISLSHLQAQLGGRSAQGQQLRNLCQVFTTGALRWPKLPTASSTSDALIAVPAALIKSLLYKSEAMEDLQRWRSLFDYYQNGFSLAKMSFNLANNEDPSLSTLDSIVSWLQSESKVEVWQKARVFAGHQEDEHFEILSPEKDVFSDLVIGQSIALHGMTTTDWAQIKDDGLAKFLVLQYEKVYLQAMKEKYDTIYLSLVAESTNEDILSLVIDSLARVHVKWSRFVDAKRIVLLLPNMPTNGQHFLKAATSRLQQAGSTLSLVDYLEDGPVIKNLSAGDPKWPWQMPLDSEQPIRKIAPTREFFEITTSTNKGTTDGHISRVHFWSVLNYFPEWEWADRGDAGSSGVYLSIGEERMLSDKISIRELNIYGPQAIMG